MGKRRILVVSAAIERDGRYLITQRLEKALLPLMWEFPGGRVEESESDVAALARELRFRLGIEVVVGELLTTREHDYPDYVVELRLYQCQLGNEEPRPLKVRDLAWARSNEFDRYTFTPADEQSMSALLFGG